MTRRARRRDPRDHIPIARFLGLTGGSAHLWWLWELLAALLMVLMVAIASRG
ncbi:MAG: hypothetical protein HYV09_17890 [Deltaproteobacteria bacterium]|nr:hypothetical protein [Deltaproteobacteria bacterium]